MRAYLRHGREVIPFGEREDAILTAMRIEGAGTTEIAKALAVKCNTRRSPATVNMRLKTLAALDEKGDRW
jgi:hypothetical protein